MLAGIVAGISVGVGFYVIAVFASRTLQQDWTVTGSLSVKGV